MAYICINSNNIYGENTVQRTRGNVWLKFDMGAYGTDIQRYSQLFCRQWYTGLYIGLNENDWCSNSILDFIAICQRRTNNMDRQRQNGHSRNAKYRIQSMSVYHWR